MIYCQALELYFDQQAKLCPSLMTGVTQTTSRPVDARSMIDF